MAVSYLLRALLQTLIISLPLASYGQADSTEAFKPLLRRFHQERYTNTFRIPADFLLPVIYRDSTYGPEKQRHLKFELSLAAKPLGLQHQVVQLRGHGYPVSYSVVFQGHLVALFKTGKFGCYQLSDLAANEELERQLNTKTWQRHWLIESQLVAQSGKRYFAFDPQTCIWHPYKQPVPFGKQPKLYEDARYLVYADCQGEFGGTAYFYNKQTKETHRVGATCANSVWQEKGQYRMLASLGHMMGGADASIIIDPELLPLASATTKKRALIVAEDTSAAKNILPLFDFYGLQLFGALRYQHQTLYLMHWRSTTFLATIAEQQITIVDPLFANSLYTHNPVTTSYGSELALTNLDFYGLGGSSEVAALLWQGQRLIKIEWGKQP
jgi:hypothetical protein